MAFINASLLRGFFMYSLISLCFLGCLAASVVQSIQSFLEPAASANEQCIKHDYAGICLRKYNENATKAVDEWIDVEIQCDAPVLCARRDRAYVSGVETTKPVNGTPCGRNKICQNDRCVNVQEATQYDSNTGYDCRRV